MICANCGKTLDTGEPKFKKEIPEKKITVVFCSEECMGSYD